MVFDHHFEDMITDLPERFIVGEMIREQVNKSVEWLGERRGILHSRRHLAVTFKGLENFRPLKIKMLRTESIEELNDILSEIAIRWADHSSPCSE